MDFTEISVLSQRMDHQRQLGNAELGAAVAELRRRRRTPRHLFGGLVRVTRRVSWLRHSDVVGAQSLQRRVSHAAPMDIGSPGLNEHSAAAGRW